MLKDTVFNLVDLGTLRLNEPAIKKPSVVFQPFKVTNRPTYIYLLDRVTPLDLYSLFKLYYILEIIERIVTAINNYIRKVS